MNAVTIQRIPNYEHTRVVLETRRALRLVPPSEGVWPCDSGSRPEGRDNAVGSVRSTAERPERSEGIAQKDPGHAN